MRSIRRNADASCSPYVFGTETFVSFASPAPLSSLLSVPVFEDQHVCFDSVYSSLLESLTRAGQQVAHFSVECVFLHINRNSMFLIKFYHCSRALCGPLKLGDCLCSSICKCLIGQHANCLTLTLKGTVALVMIVDHDFDNWFSKRKQSFPVGPDV